MSENDSAFTRLAAKVLKETVIARQVAECPDLVDEFGFVPVVAKCVQKKEI